MVCCPRRSLGASLQRRAARGGVPAPAGLGGASGKVEWTGRRRGAGAPLPSAGLGRAARPRSPGGAVPQRAAAGYAARPALRQRAGVPASASGPRGARRSAGSRRGSRCRFWRGRRALSRLVARNAAPRRPPEPREVVTGGLRGAAAGAP